MGPTWMDIKVAKVRHEEALTRSARISDLEIKSGSEDTFKRLTKGAGAALVLMGTKLVEFGEREVGSSLTPALK